MSASDFQQSFCAYAARELVERIMLVRPEISAIAVLDCQNGFLTELLRQGLSQSHIHPVNHPYGEPAEPTEDQKTDGATRVPSFSLPFEANSVELVVSNLAVTFFPLQAFASECLRILRDDGILLTSGFGPGSFRELKKACAEPETLTFKADFIDMHDFADLLLATGFTDPVTDAERQQYGYADFNALIGEINNAGFGNQLFEHSDALQDDGLVTRLLHRYPAVQENTGKFLLSVELFFGIAWKKRPGPMSKAVPFHTA